MRDTRWRWAAVVVALVGFAPSMVQAQPTIVFDYTYDSNNFFAPGSAQRVALETAAARLTSRLGDSLTAIAPSGSNTWTATFFDPRNVNNTLTTSNLNVPANTIVVYAGASSLGGSTLGIGGPGGFQGLSGTTTFINTVRARGQTGALQSPPTDFGWWGGSITFNTTTNWNFSVSSGPSFSQYDFLSVAEHELGHLLGFGTADSFDALISASGTTFLGTASTALNGGVNPGISGDRGHWASGTTYMGQEAAMTPSIANGTRKEFTELDFAGLDDLGWQVVPVPEPVSVLGVAALGLIGVRRVRRRV